MSQQYGLYELVSCKHQLALLVTADPSVLFWCRDMVVFNDVEKEIKRCIKQLISPINYFIIE